MLIPTMIAPLISNAIIKSSGEFVGKYGIKEYLPTNTLFFAAIPPGFRYISGRAW